MLTVKLMVGASKIMPYLQHRITVVVCLLIFPPHPPNYVSLCVLTRMPLHSYEGCQMLSPRFKSFNPIRPVCFTPRGSDFQTRQLRVFTSQEKPLETSISHLLGKQSAFQTAGSTFLFNNFWWVPHGI